MAAPTNPRVRKTVHVLPRKRGDWVVRQLTKRQIREWIRVWDTWYQDRGCRLAISPEMWSETDKLRAKDDVV